MIVFIGIRMLGQLNEVRAVQTLVDHITLKENIVRSGDRLWLWQDYPAAEALGNIGTPAIACVIRKMYTSHDPQTTDNCVYVLSSISERSEDGKDLVAAMYQVLLKKAKNDQKLKLISDREKVEKWIADDK